MLNQLEWACFVCFGAVGCASQSPDTGPQYHTRPIVERNGKTLLWAQEEEWFDVTDADIDPSTFQYGIGKDTIDSVDEPVFARFDDAAVAEAGIDRETFVLGVVLEGQARAYPVDLMSMHEVVNDEFAGVPYAVMW